MFSVKGDNLKTILKWEKKKILKIVKPFSLNPEFDVSSSKSNIKFQIV